jgi:hypothetical protein
MDNLERYEREEGKTEGMTIANKTTLRNKENLCKPYAHSVYLPKKRKWGGGGKKRKGKAPIRNKDTSIVNNFENRI